VLVDGALLTSVPKAQVTALAIELGDGNDRLTISAANGDPVPTGGIVYTGGNGSNTLVGPSTTNNWILTGANAGGLNPKVTFTKVASLLGGAGSDAFRFQPGGSVSGSLDGAGGTNTLDYSSFGGRVVVDLANRAATGVRKLSSSAIANIQAAVG